MSGDTRRQRPMPWTGERYVPEVRGHIRLEHLHRYFVARELAADKHVLDIACGEGYGSELLASVAAHVIGVDIDAEAVAHATARYTQPNLEFRQGACDAIPLADQSVDVVVSFETIEHHDRHEQMMREVRRILRPGGVLLLSSPDRHEYSDVPGYKNPFHVKELYLEELEALLHNHFAHVSIVGQKVQAGSLVAPLDARDHAAFLSFAGSIKPVERTEGIHRPAYFLALASDGPLPALTIGLLDGGGFIWDDDYRALAEGHTELVQVRQELQERVSQGDQRIAALETQLGESRSVLGAHDAQLAAANARLLDVTTRLADALSDLSTARIEAKAHASAAEGLEQKVRRLEGALRDTQAAAEARDAVHRDREGHLTAHVAALAQQITIYETSHSWKLTAPMRGLRRHLGEWRRRLRDSWRAPVSPAAAAQPAVSQEPATRVERAPVAAIEAPSALPGWFYNEVTPEYVPLEAATPVDTRIKLIAFYLPQFHPIPENDLWWGKGFTEWRNVARAKPQFEGHYQPHLPGELGFYDLRILETQRRQIELAKLYGLEGFCYHHYWFSGRRLLRRPLEQVLAHPELDFPFCVCWANENWTRRWDGLDDELLIGQKHSVEDDLAFIRDLEPALRDSRYIRVDGRLLLIVYRPGLLPDASATAERWRVYCRESGIGELFLVSTHAFDRRDPRDFGFDAALEFAPNNMLVTPVTSDMPHVNPGFHGAVFDYRELVEKSRSYPASPDYPLFRSVAPMWDNEPRRPSRGTVYANSSPALYREWLENTCRWTDRHHGGQPLMFVNAWNEWAEGAHLEPDRRYGYAYLQATADALRQFPARAARPSVVVVSHDAYFHGAQMLALHLARTFSERLHYEVEIVLGGPGPLRDDFDQVGRVHDFSAPGLTRDERLARARALFAGGARLAICNTSVVGEIVEVFKEAGFRVVSLIHELPGLIAEHALESSIALIARHADLVIFPAEVVRDRFLKVSGPLHGAAAVRPQGLFAPNELFGRRAEARQLLRERLGLPASATIVLAMGYADRRKGVDIFADVGSQVAPGHHDAIFVWVGHHEEQAFAEAQGRIRDAGLEDRFLFTGPSRDADLFFAGADVYLMTSREDPFPTVVLNALDAGLPVIGFADAGGFTELLRRDCGVLVPFLDVRAMAAAVMTLLDHPDAARPLVETGREILARELSFVDYARALVEPVESKRPRVSVVVPNYNYARYMEQRLRSIIGQTLIPDEIIFLDDASTDNSVQIAAEILHASRLPYRIIRNERNQGTYRQWVRGVREATGDLIWIAEADDYCAPEFLEHLVARFAASDVVLAYCQSRQVDEEGNELAADYLAYTADISTTKWSSAYVRDGIDEIRDTLLVKNTIPNVSAVVMRRADLSAIEPQLVTFKNAGDWFLYVHLLESGRIAFVPEALNSHRRHQRSVTIGKGGVNLMRETLLVQQSILYRHGSTADVEAKRQASLQATYAYLGLDKDGAASYQDHDDLKAVQWSVAG